MKFAEITQEVKTVRSEAKELKMEIISNPELNEKIKLKHCPNYERPYKEIKKSFPIKYNDFPSDQDVDTIYKYLKSILDKNIERRNRRFTKR